MGERDREKVKRPPDLDRVYYLCQSLIGTRPTAEEAEERVQEQARVDRDAIEAVALRFLRMIDHATPEMVELWRSAGDLDEGVVLGDIDRRMRAEVANIYGDFHELLPTRPERVNHYRWTQTLLQAGGGVVAFRDRHGTRGSAPYSAPA